MDTMIIVEKWIGEGGVQTFVHNFRKSLEKIDLKASVEVYGKSNFPSKSNENSRY